MSVITVNNSAALLSAITNAKGGDTIQVASGTYSAIYIKSVNPTSNVNIVSADSANPAVLTGVTVFSSSNLSFKGFEVFDTISSGQNASSAIITVNASSNINLGNLDVHGSLDGNASNDLYGIRIQNSRGVTVTDSDFHQLFRSAVFSKTDNITVARNDVTQTREGFDFSAVNNVTIEKNYFHALKPDAAKGDHPDAVQFSTANLGSSSNIVIRDNAVISGETTAVQGIFMRSTDSEFGFTNVLIQNNLYYGGSRHAITVNSATGVTIDGNTAIASSNPALVPAISVNYSTGVSVVRNISPLYIDNNHAAAQDSSNVVAYSSKSIYGATLGQLFTAPPIDPLTASVGNFIVKAGSAAASNNAGYDAVVGLGGPVGNFSDNIGGHGAAVSAVLADVFAAPGSDVQVAQGAEFHHAGIALDLQPMMQLV